MAAEAFQSLCMPGESSVSSTDLQSALTASGISNRNQELAKIIGSANGPIDQAKFEQLVQATKVSRFSSEEHAAVFRSFDDSGTGQVDFAAFSITMTQIGFPMPEEDMRAVFEQADADKDGMISEADWMATMGKPTLV